MYKIYYSFEAEDDFQDIFDYIALDSVQNAVKYLSKMEKEILKLEKMPDIGVRPRYEELVSLGLKVLIFEKYLIFYRVRETEKEVEIVRILNSQRNYVKLFNS